MGESESYISKEDRELEKDSTVSRQRRSFLKSLTSVAALGAAAGYLSRKSVDKKHRKEAVEKDFNRIIGSLGAKKEALSAVYSGYTEQLDSLREALNKELPDEEFEKLWTHFVGFSLSKELTEKDFLNNIKNTKSEFEGMGPKLKKEYFIKYSVCKAEAEDFLRQVHDALPQDEETIVEKGQSRHLKIVSARKDN